MPEFGPLRWGKMPSTLEVDPLSLALPSVDMFYDPASILSTAPTSIYTASTRSN
jgi:hypothetical protein